MYDVAIIGSGPAGYSAGIYSSRYQLKTIIFGKMMGGTLSQAHKVCNYPGMQDIAGMDLSTKMHEHAQANGCEMKFESITSVEKKGDTFLLLSDSGNTYESKTVLLTTGTERTKLTIPNEKKYLGKGLSYCATCDGNFYKDKTVGVIGGSSAATMAAIMLSNIAKQVYILYRGNELRGDPSWKEQVLKTENIHVLLSTVVTDLQGEERLESLKLSKKYKESNILDVDGVFVEIGSEPNKDLPILMGIESDEKGYLEVNQAQRANIDGIWAAGDCTTNSNGFRQVVTAASEGAIAANDIYQYLKGRS
ncbi:FAD-dependent oxidoreductase [bacterium]|nr:FAD-dependent oxidoreductase [bacterium]